MLQQPMAPMEFLMSSNRTKISDHFVFPMRIGNGRYRANESDRGGPYSVQDIYQFESVAVGETVGSYGLQHFLKVESALKTQDGFLGYAYTDSKSKKSLVGTLSALRVGLSDLDMDEITLFASGKQTFIPNLRKAAAQRDFFIVHQATLAALPSEKIECVNLSSKLIRYLADKKAGFFMYSQKCLCSEMLRKLSLVDRYLTSFDFVEVDDALAGFSDAVMLCGVFSGRS